MSEGSINKGACGPVALTPFREHTSRERFALGYQAGADDPTIACPEKAFDFFFGLGYRAGQHDGDIGADAAWQQRFRQD